MKYLGEMLSSSRSSSRRRASSAALGLTQARAPSGQSSIDAKHSTDADGQLEAIVLAAGAHRKTCATLASTHCRCRNCVGSEVSNLPAPAVSNLQTMTDHGRRSIGAPAALPCESASAPDITTPATARRIRIKSVGRVFPHGKRTSLRALQRSCNHKASVGFPSTCHF